MHNDGESFTLNSLSNEFPSTTIQSATDCFRLGKPIKQFRRLCLPSAQSLISAEGSDRTYSSIDSLNTNEDDDTLAEPHVVDDNPIIDDDEDNFVCEINTNADRYRLCKAKAAHVAVLGKIDASLAKKTLTTTEAQHLDTKSLIAKLDEVAKTIHLFIDPRFWQNKLKIQSLEQLDHGFGNEFHPNPKLPRFNNQKDSYDIAKNLTDY